MGYTGSFTCGEAKSDELLKDQAAIGAVLTPLCSANFWPKPFTRGTWRKRTHRISESEGQG